MKSVMLYFGSFNPIHKGHIAIAEWIVANRICLEVWFVVSPHNPLKVQYELIAEKHRLNMVNLAIQASNHSKHIKACDIEFDMPKPSYTIDTLTRLNSKYPEIEFSLLIGSDIVGQIEKWKEWQKLLNNYKIYVYPRRCYKHDNIYNKFILIEGAPYEDYSSTEVRCQMSDTNKSEMISDNVKEYIKENNLWKTL